MHSTSVSVISCFEYIGRASASKQSRWYIIEMREFDVNTLFIIQKSYCFWVYNALIKLLINVAIIV